MDFYEQLLGTNMPRGFVDQNFCNSIASTLSNRFSDEKSNVLGREVTAEEVKNYHLLSEKWESFCL